MNKDELILEICKSFGKAVDYKYVYNFDDGVPKVVSLSRSKSELINGKYDIVLMRNEYKVPVFKYDHENGIAVVLIKVKITNQPRLRIESLYYVQIKNLHNERYEKYD